MKSKILLATVFATGLALLSGFQVDAHDTMDAQKDLGDLVGESALVIHGRVVDIQYRNSNPTREEPNGVPHTFVTYEVRETLRGRESVQRLTLRFVGGADGRGGIYMESTTPTFARGQEDILMVQGGALDDCPLVDCVEGRFRVIDGRVYNGWGVPIVEAVEHLRMGGRGRPDVNIMEIPRPSFDALIERPEVQVMMRQQLSNMSMQELRQRYEAEAPEWQTVAYEIPREPNEDRGGGQPVPPLEQFGPPLTVEEFYQAIRFHVERAPAPRGSVPRVDPNQAFTVRPPQPARFEAAAETPRLGEEEMREMESMREGALDGDGNTGERPTLPQPTRPQIEPQIQRPNLDQLQQVRPEIERQIPQRTTIDPRVRRAITPPPPPEEDDDDDNGNDNGRNRGNQ